MTKYRNCQSCGTPVFLAGFFTHGIPRLERWRNTRES